LGAKEPTEDDDEVVSYAEPSRGIYKKLIIRGDGIAGGIMMGDSAVVRPIMQAFADDARLGGQRAEWLFPTVAVIGPVCRAALKEHGVASRVMPAVPKMGPLIAALAEYFDLTSSSTAEP